METNPFSGYLDKLKVENPDKKVNPVHEIVNSYFIAKGIDNKPKEFYKGRYSYGKLAKEAKVLLQNCGNDLDDAMWALDQMRYKADKGGFDWSIITCIKHNLKW